MTLDPDVDRKIFWSHPITGEVLDHKGRRLTPTGAEIPDPVPIAPPLGYKKQPSIFEHMRQLIQNERIRQDLISQGVETFEESDDFDVDDDYDPTSPWENEFEPPLQPLLEAAREIQDAPKKGSKRSSAAADDESPEGAEPRPKAATAKPKPGKTPPDDQED